MHWRTKRHEPVTMVEEFERDEKHFFWSVVGGLVVLLAIYAIMFV